MSVKALWLDEPVSGDPSKDPKALAEAFESLAGRLTTTDLPSALAASNHKALAASGAQLAEGVPVTIAVADLPSDAALWVVLSSNSQNPDQTLLQASQSFRYQASMRSSSRRLLASVGGLALVTSVLAAFVGGFLFPSFPDFFSASSLSVRLAPIFALLFAIFAAFTALTAHSSATKVALRTRQVAALWALSAPSVTLPVSLHLWLVGRYLNFPDLSAAGVAASAGDAPTAALASTYPDLSRLVDDGLPFASAASVATQARVCADRSVLESSRFSLLWLVVPVSGAVLIGTIAGVVLPILEASQ